jgi:capsular polysaccharide biosynthesis protein
MKKFSRCVLILILVAIISGVAGYMYENKKILPMYESTTQLYVVPGEENEASIRASNGGLKEDFTIIFKSNVVISAAQKIAGTSEDIAQYLEVSSPANSNIVEIKCVNPDQNTAKKYVDAVAATAIKTTSIIPVNSIQILSEGTSSGVAFKPDLYRNIAIITGIASAICLFIEVIVCLFMSAFKSKDDDYNHEFEYERRFGHMDYIDHKPQLIEDGKDKQAKAVSAANVDEAEVLDKLEHEVSDYFNEGKEEKNKKSRKRKKSSGKSEDDIIKQPETYVVNSISAADEEQKVIEDEGSDAVNSIGAADEEQEVIEDEGSDAVNSIGAADEEQEVIEDEGSDAVNNIGTADEEQEVIKNETSEIVYNAEEAVYAKPEVEDVHNGKPEMDVTYSADAVDVEQEETENKGSDVVNSIDSADEEQEEAAFTKPEVENAHSGKPEMEVPYSDEEADKKQEDTDKPVTEVVYKAEITDEEYKALREATAVEADDNIESEVIRKADKLSDEELKNIEIEDQAAATIDEDQTVEKVLQEAAETFSSDVADIQEASKKNYRIIGTIRK